MKVLVTPALLSCAIVIAACTTTGTGYGDLEKGPSGPITFSWTSSDGGESGTMSLSAGMARSFSGPFYQITSQTRISDLSPLWDGWEPGWGAWGHNEERFITHYSGHVLANLTDAKGKHMRCRFSLADPYAGMRGGGSGECQIPGVEKIDATFPPT